jgi:hypothetical protein
MSKTRSAGLLAAAAMALVAPLAHAAQDGDQSKQLTNLAETTAAVSQIEILPADLSALYAAVSSNLRVTTSASGTKSVPFVGGMILMARIDEQGNVVTACVDSEEAAREFLARKKAPVRIPEAQ